MATNSAIKKYLIPFVNAAENELIFIPQGLVEGTHKPLVKWRESGVDIDTALKFKSSDLFNIAVKTGKRLIAFDCDSLEAFDFVNSRTPVNTLVTGSGALDRATFWFTVDKPFNAVRIVSQVSNGKLEVKYEGQSQTVYGSHRSGDGREYSILRGEVIQPIPATLLELVTKQETETKPSYRDSLDETQWEAEWVRDYKIAHSIADFYEARLLGKDNDPLSSRESWLSVMQAIGNRFGDDYSVTEELCQRFTWEEYHDTIKDQLSSFVATTNVTFGTLVKFGKDIGWQLPSELKADAQPVNKQFIIGKDGSTIADDGEDSAESFKLNDPFADQKKQASTPYTVYSASRVKLDNERGYYFKVDKHWEFLGWNTSKIQIMTGDWLLNNGRRNDTSEVRELMNQERVRWQYGDHQPNSLLGFRNGFLDPVTGSFSEWNDSVFVTRYIDCDYKANYEPSDEPKGFINHLRFMFKEFADDVAIPIIRAYINCVLRNDTKHQTFLSIIGNAGTGKSVISKLIEAILTDSATTITLTELAGSHGTETLVGKSFITVHEVEASESRMDQTKLKQLTGGDSIFINPKGAKGYKANINANIMILSNRFLSFKDDAGSMARRMIQLPVLATESEVKLKWNPDLDEELKTEIPQIVSWALADTDSRRLLHFAPSDNRLARHLGAYQDVVDPATKAIDDILVFDIKHRASNGDLKFALETYLSYHNPSKTMPSWEHLSELIIKVGKRYDVEVVRGKSNGKRGLIGVKVDKALLDEITKEISLSRGYR